MFFLFFIFYISNSFYKIIFFSHQHRLRLCVLKEHDIKLHT
jgi:hypothetical protein